jgi:cell division septum initiation protein DivIVA
LDLNFSNGCGVMGPNISLDDLFLVLLITVTWGSIAFGIILGLICLVNGDGVQENLDRLVTFGLTAIGSIVIVFSLLAKAGHGLLRFVLEVILFFIEFLFGALPMAFRRGFGGKCIQCNVKTTHKIYSTYLIEFMKKNERAEKKAYKTYSTHWATLLTHPEPKKMMTNQRDNSSQAEGSWVKIAAVFVCDSSCKKEFVAEWENHAILLDKVQKAREEEARLAQEAWEEARRLKREAREEEALAEYEAREEEARLRREAIEEEARIKREAIEEEARRKAEAALAKKKLEEKAALAKKQAAALDKRLKQKQVQEERLLKAKEKQALENKNSILNLLMEQDVHPDFISDLTENISASVMIRYEFRDVLLSLWTPLGKPKKNSAYHYWQGWVLANADYSVGIEETKSSILKLIKTTIHEMQEEIPDIMDLAISIDDFHRLVGLWEKHDHLGHNEIFVLADIDALQS